MRGWVACVEAGCPGRIPHALRRTAVRNMVRARVPERVAMIDRSQGRRLLEPDERYEGLGELGGVASLFPIHTFPGDDDVLGPLGIVVNGGLSVGGRVVAEQLGAEERRIAASRDNSVPGGHGSLGDVDAQASTGAGDEPHFLFTHGMFLNCRSRHTLVD